MCLAILKLPNSIIPEDHLSNGFDSNPHGAGFSWVRDGELFIRKGFFDIGSFMDAYRESVAPEDLATVHFRLATHGAKNEFNCHPFVARVQSGKPTMSLIHNGIIHGWGNVRRQGNYASDTAHFCADFVLPLLSAVSERDLSFQRVREASKAGKNIEETSNSVRRSLAVMRAIANVSGGAKLCVISRTGDWNIFAERDGHWIEGVWYSNCGYKAYEPVRWTGRGTVNDGSFAFDPRDLTDEEIQEIEDWSRAGQ